MKNESIQEYNLWKSFKEGNEASFYKLYDQYADLLFHFGCHFSKDHNLIQDCVHDLYLDLYKYRNNLSMTSNIRFYLLGSLKRKIRNEQLKASSIVCIDSVNDFNNSQDKAIEDSIVASEIQAENSRMLKQAIKELSDRQRESLSLKFEYDLSYTEIAEIMNISVESARTSVYRGLKVLRKSICNGKIIIGLLCLFEARKFKTVSILI
jgi:RNA polymerase sigma factor (sigma-70 family)